MAPLSLPAPKPEAAPEMSLDSLTEAAAPAAPAGLDMSAL